MPRAVDLFGPNASTLTGGGGLFDAPRKPIKAKVSDLLAGTAVDTQGDVPVEDLLPKNQGAFLSALNYIGRFGQVGKNIALGDFEGALRQGADIVGDTVDSVLPGDWIPEISRAQDYKTGSDVLRVDKQWQEDHPFLNMAASLPVDLALDPLTWVGFGPLAKGAGLIGKGAANVIGKVPGGAEALAAGDAAAKTAGHTVRKTFAALKPTDDIAKAEAAAIAKGGSTRLAGQSYPVEAFAGVDPEVQRMAVETLRGVTRKAEGGYADLGMESAKEFLTKPEQMALIDQRLAVLGIDDATRQSVRETAEKIVDYTRGKWKEGIGNKVFTPGAANAAAQHSDDAAAWLKINKPASGAVEDSLAPLGAAETQARQAALKTLLDRAQGKVDKTLTAEERAQKHAAAWSLVNKPSATKGAGDLTQLANQVEDIAPADYYPGRYEIPDAADAVAPAGKVGMPSPIKAASIKTSKDLAEYLTKEGGTLETNIGQTLGEYGEKLGQATQAATMGRSVAGSSFKALADPASRKAVQDIADGLRAAGDLDSAHVIETTVKGLAQPGAFVNMLGKANKPFKAAATGGILIPRINFTLGNISSAVWQAFSTKGSRGQTWNTAKRVIPTIFGSIGDGLKQLGIHAIPESDAAIVANAARQSGGTHEGMLKLIKDPDLREAVEHGILDGGFVNAEQMAAQAEARLKGMKSLDNWLYWPQAIAKSSEQRLRYGMFKDLKATVKDPAERARIIDESLLNYRLVSTENRGARSAIPFFQFAAKTIPQQAKLLYEKPAVAVGLSSLLGEKEGKPVYPHMESKLNIPVGQDEMGDQQYLSSLRLPFESLGMIPDISASPQRLGRSLEQDIVGSGHPLLKSLYAMTSDQDPYFGTPYGSYSKLPGNIDAGAAGRAYNMLAGTGLIQPLASIGQTVGKIADDRTSVGDKALSLLTGAKVQSVDEDRALQQKLTEYLSRHPEVASFESLYSKSENPEVKALLKQLQVAKKRASDKRKATK